MQHQQRQIIRASMELIPAILWTIITLHAAIEQLHTTLPIWALIIIFLFPLLGLILIIVALVKIIKAVIYFIQHRPQKHKTSMISYQVMDSALDETSLIVNDNDETTVKQRRTGYGALISVIFSIIWTVFALSLGIFFTLSQGALGFIMLLVFGGFGILLMIKSITSLKKQTSPIPDINQADTATYCINCHSYLKPDQKYCPYCGKHKN